jgi:copper oxidase (laccase) domain-containing protein
MHYTITVIDLGGKENKNLSEGILLPEQTHSNNIVEIKTGEEDLSNCDGLITRASNTFALGVRTADCASICFYDNKHYGVVHAGWRGVVNGIIEKMLERFTQPTVFVGPFLKRFEIQKDDCYKQLRNKLGNTYFTQENEKLYFEFEKALASILPKGTAFDGRDTFQDPDLASWRRDHDARRNITCITH